MRNNAEGNPNHFVDDVQITPHTGSTHHPPGQKRKNGQGWYARMSDAKKAEYLERRRLARQQKKAALSQPDATSLPSLHRAPLSNITNSVTNGIHTSPSPNINVTDEQVAGKHWYAKLTKAQKEEHLMKLRFDRQQNRNSAMEGHDNYTSPGSSGISQSDCTLFQSPSVLHTPYGSSGTLENSDSDWLHSNLSYERQSMPSKNNLELYSDQMTDFQPFIAAKQLSASADKKRRRDRERYSLMNDQQKGAYLQNKRGYNQCKRRATTLPTQSGSVISEPVVPSLQEQTRRLASTGNRTNFDEPDQKRSRPKESGVGTLADVQG